jgi:hypothetical protein
MQKEGLRHYSDQPGHKARSDFWNQARLEQKQLGKLLRGSGSVVFYPQRSNRLVGHEVKLPTKK